MCQSLHAEALQAAVSEGLAQGEQRGLRTRDPRSKGIDSTTAQSLPTTCLSICLPICMSVCLSFICLSICLHVCLFVSLTKYVCLSICLPICLCICLFVRLPLSVP